MLTERYPVLPNPDPQLMAFQSMTLHTTVRYVDRVLSIVAVTQEKLQLVGLACLVLAAKYEEIEVGGHVLQARPRVRAGPAHVCGRRQAQA